MNRFPPPIGYARLDEDHDEFVGLVSRLRHAGSEDVLAAHAALHDHAIQHFAFEDSLMGPHDFASKECHLDEHAAVLHSFDEVRTALLAGNAAVAARFADHLLEWLPAHVDALDRQLAKFIFYRETGGAPVLLHR